MHICYNCLNLHMIMKFYGIKLIKILIFEIATCDYFPSIRPKFHLSYA